MALMPMENQAISELGKRDRKPNAQETLKSFALILDSKVHK